MNITRLGTFVFNTSTNIVVDGGIIELPGVGLSARDPLRPVPVSFRIALIRPTKATLDAAINQLVNEVYNEDQHRRFAQLATVRRGIEVWFDAAQTYSSILLNATLRTISLQNVANGVMATIEISGTLAYPPAQTISPQPTISALASFEVRDMTLNVAPNNELLLHNYILELTQNANIRDVLFAIETRPSSTDSGTIFVFNATSAASNFSLSTWAAGSATRLRYTMTGGSNGTITYSVSFGEMPNRPLALFVCVFAPTTTADSRMNVAWDGQPTITEPLSALQYIYPIGIYSRGLRATTITVDLSDVPVNTYVDPLIFLPTEGVFTVYARRSVTSTSGPQRIRKFHPFFDKSENFFSPLQPDIEIYGNPFIVTSQFVCYLLATNVNTSTASFFATDLKRISPALYI